MNEESWPAGLGDPSMEGLKQNPHVLYVSLSDGPGKGWIRDCERDYQRALIETGLFPIGSPQNQSQDMLECGNPVSKGKEVSAAFASEDIKGIFDISGGNCANTVLPHLDIRKLTQTDSMIWGYSDLTTVLNAIYQKTARPSVLYQTRHLAGDDEEAQSRRRLFKKNPYLHSVGIAIDFSG